MMKIATLEVDPQCTFSPLCPAELPVQGGDEIADELNRQAMLATLRVLTKDAHPANAVWVVPQPDQMLQPLSYPNADLTWVAHAVPGTRGFETIPGLPAIAEYDFVVWKGIEADLHPYGACYHDLSEKMSTGLIEWLRVNEVSIILLGGLATDYCVKTTALQLHKTGLFQVWVNLAACRGIAEASTKAACDEMQQVGIQLFDNATHMADALHLLS
ncbi:MAG: isochorismatase family protein [Plesiomonas sp.]